VWLPATTSDRWHQVNSRAFGEGIIETGALSIDSDDHAPIGRNLKARQDVGDA
jgi:hypothetical protein